MQHEKKTYFSVSEKGHPGVKNKITDPGADADVYTLIV